MEAVTRDTSPSDEGEGHIVGAFAKKAQATDAKNRRCIAARAFDGFDDEDMAELRRLVVGRRWKVIADTGFEAGEMAVRKHAAGTCCCLDGTPLKGVLLDG